MDRLLRHWLQLKSTTQKFTDNVTKISGGIICSAICPIGGFFLPTRRMLSRDMYFSYIMKHYFNGHPLSGVASGILLSNYTCKPASRCCYYHYHGHVQGKACRVHHLYSWSPVPVSGYSTTKAMPFSPEQRQRPLSSTGYSRSRIMRRAW